MYVYKEVLKPSPDNVSAQRTRTPIRISNFDFILYKKNFLLEHKKRYSIIYLLYIYISKYVIQEPSLAKFS